MKRVREFELQEELGRGPHAAVYHGLGVHTRQPMVVKEMHGRAPERAGARAQVESVISRLQMWSHGDIAPNPNIFWVEDRLYLTREFMVGPSLADRSDITPRTPQQVESLLRPLVPAIHSLQESRLIHGNLSPQNISLVEGGKPKLLDPACALIARDLRQERATRTWSPYSAPELTDRDSFDESAEVYSLAGLVTFLMTGEPPGAGGTNGAEPNSLATVVTDDLACLLQQAQSREPGRRHANVTEFWREFTLGVEAARGRLRPSAGPEANTSRALVYCRRCGRTAPAAAAACLGCGKPLRIPHPRVKPPFYAARKPGDRTYFHDYGDWLIERGKVGDAARIFARATSDDESPELLRSLGLAQLTLGNYIVAQSALACALHVHPDDEGTRLALAQTLVGRGNPGAAMRHYLQLQRSRDSQVAAAATVGTAVALAIQKRIREVPTLLQPLLSSCPRHANAHYVLGEAYRHLGDSVAAEDALLRAQQLEPCHEGVRHALDEVREARRAYPDSLQRLLFYV